MRAQPQPIARNARRIAVFTGGACLLLVGVLISPLPGPGLSILGPLALAVLATEFLWAKRLLRRIEQGARIPPLSPRNRTLLLVAIPLLVTGYWLGAWGAARWTGLPPLVVWMTASVGFAPIGAGASFVLYVILRPRRSESRSPGNFPRPAASSPPSKAA